LSQYSLYNLKKLVADNFIAEVYKNDRFVLVYYYIDGHEPSERMQEIYEEASYYLQKVTVGSYKLVFGTFNASQNEQKFKWDKRFTYNNGYAEE